MAETIGTQLRQEREKRDMSIDDVAHATRIHATNILGLEADDYSGFASTTYAKSFLKIYSEYLDIDATESLEQFGGASAVTFGSGYGTVAEKLDVGGQRDGYFSRSGGDATPKQTKAAPSGEQGGAPVFLGLILLLVMIAIPTFYFIGRDANSAEEALENAKELSKGNLESVTPGAKEAAPEPEAPVMPARAPGPNPDAGPSIQEPVNVNKKPIVAVPVEPLVARPVELPEPRAIGGATETPAGEPATPVEEPEKPRNQFGFPGN